MSTMDVSGVLAQIRALKSQASGLPFGVQAPGAATSATSAPGAPAVGKTGGFADTLSKAIDSVNQTQMQTQTLQNKFERGDPNTDLASVMLSMQRSRVAMAATVEVRNRVVSAYQDIMNMPI